MLNTVHANFMRQLYPVMLDDLYEVAKREMKEKSDGDLGSWKRAVTTADGTWQTRVVRLPHSLLDERCTPVLPPPLPEGQG